MSGLLNDPSRVVVLERVVRKMILQQCQSAAFPDMALADWQTHLQQEHELFVKFAFRDGTTPELAADMLSAATLFTTFSEALADDFNGDGG